jgi:hypothetical protein
MFVFKQLFTIFKRAVPLDVFYKERQGKKKPLKFLANRKLYLKTGNDETVFERSLYFSRRKRADITCHRRRGAVTFAREFKVKATVWKVEI